MTPAKLLPSAPKHLSHPSRGIRLGSQEATLGVTAPVDISVAEIYACSTLIPDPLIMINKKVVGLSAKF